MNPDAEDVFDLNPKNATGSLEYLGGQSSQYCVISMVGGQRAVCTDIRLTSLIEAILEERKWADIRSTAVNFNYVTVKGIIMIHSIQTLTKWVDGVGSVTVNVPQLLVPVKTELCKLSTQKVSTPVASFSTARTSRRFEATGDSGISDGASTVSANVFDRPSEHMFSRKPAPLIPSSYMALNSVNRNDLDSSRKQVLAKQLNSLVGSSICFPKREGNDAATGFPAFGTRNSTLEERVEFHPAQSSPTADQAYSAKKADKHPSSISSSSSQFVENVPTIGIISNRSGAKFSFTFPKSTANNGFSAAHTSCGTFCNQDASGGLNGPVDRNVHNGSFFSRSTVPSHLESEQANPVSKQFPKQIPSTSRSPPFVFPRSSVNYPTFATTFNNSIDLSVDCLSEQSPECGPHLFSSFPQSLGSESNSLPHVERLTVTANPTSIFSPPLNDQTANICTNNVRPSANLEDNSQKSKFRKIDQDLHNCDEALLHQIQNEWYYEPFMLNKLDYPFTTGGFIDKRNFSGSTFTFYSRRTGAIEIADTEERKRKNAIYGYCMVIGPRNCTAWEFAKPPHSFKSTKFLKRGAIEVKGYGILAAAGERNERNWLLWSDHLGLISCLPSAGRNIKGKYKNWTPTLQAVMFDAEEEEGQWKVKNLSHVEYETMSKNKWFPDHLYFVNDVVKQNTGKGCPPKFYSKRLSAEINVRRKENVIDNDNDGKNLEAFVVFEWHTATEGEFFALAVYPPRYRTSNEQSIFQKLLPHVHIVENWETDNVNCTPMENNARSRL